MFFIIGVFVVLGSVVTGYLMHHGKLYVLWQPNEFVIICGAAIGAFIIANPKEVISDTLKSLKYLLKSKPFSKKDYTELLCFLYTIFKLIKSKGMLEIESHIENPHESEVFKKFPNFHANHHAVEFVCDYLRILTMGVDNQYHIEDSMERELEAHHHEHAKLYGSIATMADGMPALGIVAAVLGVITTMGSINEPPVILGGMIGAALVGTFLGVLLSYGIIAPISSNLGKYYEAEGEYYKCIKVCFIAFVQGNAAAICVEFARKVIPSHERPSFRELEEAINSLS